MNSSKSSKNSRPQASKFAARIFCVLIPVAIALSAPPYAAAQTDSPYSFATGRKVNVQTEENIVAEASEDLITTLKGPKGEFLALTSTALALFSLLVGMRAGAIVFGAMAILALSLSHPFIALALTALGVLINRSRTKYSDIRFQPPTKATDAWGKPIKSPSNGQSAQPGEKAIQPPTPPAQPPKISRPM